MYIIDVQGFQHGKNLEFICKEISIFSTENRTSVHKILRPQTRYQLLDQNIKAQINWNTRHLHGLRWSSSADNLPYRDLRSFIEKNVVEGANVLVKGLEKKKWLQYYLPNNNILDITEYDCNKIKDLMLYNLEFHCKSHWDNRLRCTEQNVFSIHQWYIVNRHKF